MLRTFVSATTSADGVTSRRGFLNTLGVAAGAITLSWRDMLLARAKEIIAKTSAAIFPAEVEARIRAEFPDLISGALEMPQ